MPKLSPKQEQEITGALVDLTPTETHETLREESIGKIKHEFGYSIDEAVEILKDLDGRLIEASITPGGELDERKPIPVARWYWQRT